MITEDVSLPRDEMLDQCPPTLPQSLDRNDDPRKFSSSDYPNCMASFATALVTHKGRRPIIPTYAGDPLVMDEECLPAWLT